jgi:hypothetical protein
MDSEKIKRMMDDTYDSSREDSIRAMLSEFYSRKMRATAAFIWALGLLFFVLAIYSAVRFLGVVETRDQILYAAIFICAIYLLGLMKIFAWQMIHRNSIKREIKKLELRIAELAEAMKKPAG